MKKLILLTLILVTGRLMAAPGEAWHIPSGTESAISTTMRAPLYEVKDNDVVIYQGFWKDSGTNGNQDGGTLHYRLTPTGGSTGSWQTVALSFEKDSGANQYWKATLPSAAVDATDLIEYYIEVTFDDVTGSTPEDTFLFGGDLDGHNQKTVTESEAQAAPYSIRNRPGWIFHANDRTVSGNSISIALKTGYIGPDNDAATRWANQGVIYYTTDGSTPDGAFGTGSGTTLTTALNYDGVVGDNSGNGNAAVWRGTLVDVLDSLPLGSQVKYKLGLWNTATNEEKFADHVAGTESAIFTYQHGQIGEPSLTVGGLNANYTTTKVFVDEIVGDSIPLNIIFEPGEANVVDAEIYTNLNRRDRADNDANADGYPDGITGLDGNLLTAGDDTHYYKAYEMTSAGAGTYTLTLPANTTGAYRLTARWKVDGDPVWRWYTNGGANRRDHAITVSPTDARDISLYEMNVLNVEASGDTFETRSTLEDLHNAPGAPHNGNNNRWDLDYLKALGANCLWFQPIHPAGIDGREPTGGYGSGSAMYDPGSPYAVKNFFAVNPLFTKNFSGSSTSATDLGSPANRAAAMTAWQDFVDAADTKEVGIMLDAPFNHTAFDVEISAPGIPILQPDSVSWSATDEIRNLEARFFSNSSNYGNRASDAGSIAAGPDRYDFGKWNDVKDVFFGRYDALVEEDNEPERSSYTSEGDWFDASDTDWTNGDITQGGQSINVTRRTWEYFARYATFWLEKTRPAGENRNSTSGDGDIAARYAWDKKGIDGLRCDFGQGLPPQAWEYIINVARSHKWNFVMMSESLDGGAVTYRSNRHFDILNENIVFPLKSAVTKYDYRNIFDGRRNAYGQGLVLLNNTSHDEESFSDPWQALVRFSVTATVDGVPLIFPGQELGIGYDFGYSHYEENFGKKIAHFKRYNSMMPAWNDNDFGNDQLFKVYAGLNGARNFSPALRSSNRWFLDGNGNNDRIHAVAKYETDGASPVFSDVVLAFSNLDRDNDKQDQFVIPVDLAPKLGIKDARTYNVRNIAAYLPNESSNRRDVWQWPTAETGAALKSTGFLVVLNNVPTSEAEWSTAPFEGQFLKLYDVTAPTTTPATPVMPNNHDYEIGSQATFDWADVPADSEGIVPHYEVTVIINSGNPTTYITTESQFTVSASEGNQVSISVRAVNPEATENKGPTSSQSQAIKLLSAIGDEDLDGISNADEKAAGTNPRDANSRFVVASQSMEANGDVTITWDPIAGKTYTIQTRESLSTGDWIDGPTGLTSGTWIDPNPSPDTKFYRIVVE